MKSIGVLQAWEVKDRQSSLSLLKSNSNAKNTQTSVNIRTKPGKAHKEVLGEGTPVKVVVTKHLKRPSDLKADKPVKAVGTLGTGGKKQRRSCAAVQKLPLALRTLYHGRTWRKVEPGEKELDCDPGWEKEHMVLRFADIIDLNEGERAVMANWNRFFVTIHSAC